MDDQNQNSKIVGAGIMALLAIFLGYGFIHGNLQSQRPYSPLAAANLSEVEDLHRVESRLWQDPFESFESETNPTAEAESSTNTAADRTRDEVRQILWDDIKERSAKSHCPLLILGVTLPGGSYGEDKEVRLRLRYAVEVALLTKNVGPEDSTHIYTNSVWLNLTNSWDGGDKNARISQYAYEWFSTENTANNCQVCVLWLNEDDLADNPAWRFGSLFENIPGLQDTNGVSFYLIGPRSSGTLKGLAETATNQFSQGSSDIYSTLTGAALAGHFHILSPEATASLMNGDPVDPADLAVGTELTGIFQTNVFYNWIATDQQVGELIAQELASRLTGPLEETTNVVVLLSEQDTYYGRKLADEWSYALEQYGICDSNHIWQYSYLRGLDGSKAATETPDASSTSDTTPDSAEAAIETAMTQQRAGQRADGDAQLDYLVRLGDFLKKKDDKLKEEGSGRIIAFGFTGSDTYDKLILLEELRDKFPEAVFFTSDLDAALWTTQEKRYTRDLLVGSAYPVNPFIRESNTQPLREEFAPFRDVYQTAVFRACYAVINVEENVSTNLGPKGVLRGGLYKIGRNGPIRLTDWKTPESPDYDASGYLPIEPVLVGTVGFVGLLAYFLGGFGSGIRWGRKQESKGPETVEKEKEKEREYQVGIGTLVKVVLSVLLTVSAAGLFYYWTWKIAMNPGEEPWSFSEGVSIWPTEYIRFLAIICGVFFFFVIAAPSRASHLKRLWKDYFSESDIANMTDESWKKFYDTWKRKSKVEQSASLLSAWMPPIDEPKTGAQSEACINMAKLFKSYIHLSHWPERLARMLICVPLYLAMMVSIIFLLHDLPTYLLIRGPRSHLFDTRMLLLLTFLSQFVLFWVFDYSLLTNRVLNYISHHAVCWPDTTRRKNAVKFGVTEDDISGLVSVDYAAVQTAWAAPMMFWPIILQLLLVFSRCPYFDNWTWPPGLILVFAMNFLMAIACWWMVRRAAYLVQKKALKRLNETILAVKISPEKSPFNIPDPKANEALSVDRDIYLKNLKRVRKEIREERRGAFAKWFQDPSYLAIFIPSGASGIITLFAAYFLKK